MAKTKPKKNGAVEKKLVGLADLVITAADRAKDPTLAIPIRALSNVSFNERKGMIEMGGKKQARSFFNVGMAKKFMQTMLGRRCPIGTAACGPHHVPQRNLLPNEAYDSTFAREHLRYPG